MTLVLIEKGLVLEGWSPRLEDNQVPGPYLIYLRRWSDFNDMFEMGWNHQLDPIRTFKKRKYHFSHILV